jgi:glycolate oxidase
MGGTVTGEHGIGRVKKKYLPQQMGEGGMMAMRAIKRALDPNNILNPGLGLGD